MGTIRVMRKKTHANNSWQGCNRGTKTKAYVKLRPSRALRLYVRAVTSAPFG